MCAGSGLGAAWRDGVPKWLVKYGEKAGSAHLPARALNKALPGREMRMESAKRMNVLAGAKWLTVLWRVGRLGRNC
jgi:hypothetical protein